MGDPRAALALLTRIPIGYRVSHGPAGAAGWFPAVGLLVGAASIAVRAGLEPMLGAAAATTAAVLAGIMVTGAFHEDGLADSVDGLWGGATPQRRLEIMRDSRIGTYGVIALTAEVALRITLLAPVGLGGFVRAVLAAEVISRLAPLALVAWLPSARADGQGARTEAAGVAAWTLAAVTALAVAVATAGPWAPALFAAAGLSTWVVGRLARARIGGMTGDVLGASVCLSRLAVATVVVALTRAGAW